MVYNYKNNSKVIKRQKEEYAKKQLEDRKNNNDQDQDDVHKNNHNFHVLMGEISEKSLDYFGLNIFKGYCFKNVYTYNKKEFEKYLKENKIS